MEPSVSVIMPTYNRENLIKDAILSVLGQIFQRFELIIVDDGSSDNTSEVVLKLAESDSRIRYLYQKNQGVSAARNYGICCSKPTNYVAFIDSDDTWNYNHLDKAVSFLDMCPELVLVFSRMNIVDNFGQYEKEGAPQLHNKRLDAILQTARKFQILNSYILDSIACTRALIRDELTPRMSTVVIRRNMVSAPLWFDTELQVLEDLDFFISISNNHFGFMNETHGNYRHFGDNLTGLRDLKSAEMLKRQLSVLAFNQKKLKLSIEPEDKSIVLKKIADVAYLVGQCMSEQKKSRLAIVKIYIKSLQNKFSFSVMKSLIGVFIPRILKNTFNSIHFL